MKSLGLELTTLACKTLHKITQKLVDRIQKYAIFVLKQRRTNKPNWCNNFITICGPEKKIKQIQKHAIKGDLLNYFMPMPKELNDTTSPSSSADKPQPKIEGFDNWYDWRVHNWGTKWDIDVYTDAIRQTDPETIQYSFDRA